MFIFLGVGWPGVVYFWEIGFKKKLYCCALKKNNNMKTDNLTSKQKESLFYSLRDQKSKLTKSESITLNALRPSVKIIDVKRTRNINNQCAWDKVVTTYKSCTLLFCKFGIYSMLDIPKSETHVTNLKISQNIIGYKLIK